MKKDNTNKSGFWSCLGDLAQSFLAHVNITYNGATQSFHIDIVPTEYIQEVPEQQVIEEKPKQKLLEQKEKSGNSKGPENHETATGQRKSGQNTGRQTAQRQ